MSHLADYRHPPMVRRVLSSLVAVVCPPDAGELGLTRDIVDHVELTMRASQRGVRVALLAGISGYELGAAAIPSHLGRTASRLSLAQHQRYFARWWHSTRPAQQQLARGVKSLLCMACYEQPAMKARIGYTPEPWIDAVKKRRLATYEDAIRERERAILAPDPLPSREAR